MRIAVIGLGGVGGYIGANLAMTSHEVVGFARGEHLSKIQANGIKIIEDSQTANVKLDTKELAHSDGYFDIVLFCVKSYDLKSSYEAIKNSCDAETIMLSFSNGVINGDTLRTISDSIVLDACVYILSHIQKSGVIRKKGKVFAAVFGGDEKATKIVETLFNEANLRTKTPSDIKTAIWKKYIFICAFATLTSYYDKSIGYIYEYHKDEAEALLKEIALVAQSLNINIEEEIEKALNTASKVPYDSSTSMHLDFKNKKRDELKTLSAYVVEIADAKKIKVPLMSKMYKELLKKHIDY